MQQPPYGAPPPSGGYPPPGYGPPQYPHPGHYGPPHGTPNGPTDHPSLNAVLGLGLASVFCLGALLGVPAIILGRKVVADVTREPGRWRGAGTAQFGIVLGWISVFGTAFIVAMKAMHGLFSATLGMIIALIGLTLLAISAMKNLPSPLASVCAMLRRTPLAVGLPLAGVFVGSSCGLMGAISLDRQAAQRCTEARAQYAATVKGDDFASMRSAISSIARECEPKDDELAAMRRNVEVSEAEGKKRKDEEERARQAKVAAEKEKTAVEGFPEKSKEITTIIAGSQSKVLRGRFEAADEDLDKAQRQLDDFKGTSIEQSKGFSDLAGQIIEKRKVIQPQVDRIKEARRKADAAAAEKRRQEEEAAEEKQRKEDAAAALKAAVRGPKPTNSAWDGSVPEVERYLKTVLNDPGSYEHIRSTQAVGEGDYWVVASSFRAKNGFGALIINTKKFYIQRGQVVKTADVSSDD
jgi:hypothetical protein